MSDLLACEEDLFSWKSDVEGAEKGSCEGSMASEAPFKCFKPVEPTGWEELCSWSERGRRGLEKKAHHFLDCRKYEVDA